MEKATFVKDFSLQVRYFSQEALGSFTHDSFFSTYSKRTVLGELSEATLPELFEQIKSHDIVNGIFDIEFDFGDDSAVLALLDDTLLTGYACTAYAQLFEQVIEPTYGKGNVFAVIHGGTGTDDMVVSPIMQLIIVADDTAIWNKDKDEWTSEFKAFLQPLQQGIVDFVGVTYPNYVTSNTQWVELMTFDHSIQTTPLIDSKPVGQ